MPYFLSLFCLAFCAVLFSLFRTVVLSNLNHFVLITQISLCEGANCETPLDIIVYSCYLVRCRYKCAAFQLPALGNPQHFQASTVKTVAYRAPPDPVTKSDDLM